MFFWIFFPARKAQDVRREEVHGEQVGRGEQKNTRTLTVTVHITKEVRPQKPFFERGGKPPISEGVVPDLIISLNGFLYVLSRGNSEQLHKQPHNSMGVGTMTISSS